MSKSRKGIVFSEKHRKNIGKAKIGSKHPNWKSDDVGYGALHSWIERRKGKPKVCEHCGATCKERRLCWANKDHTYKRILDDFISLCYHCHEKYDQEFNNKYKNKNYE